MKKTIILFVLLLTLLPASKLQAESVLASSPKKIELLSIEKTLEDMEEESSSVPNDSLIFGSSDQLESTRTCPFCWIVGVIFGFALIFYGQSLKKYKKLPKDWFKKPMVYAVLAYFTHAILHFFFASSIFLEYYWMILFDELLIGYIYYNLMFASKKKIKLKAVY